MQRYGLEQRTEYGHSAGSPKSLPALPAARCADKSLASTAALTLRLLLNFAGFVLQHFWNVLLGASQGHDQHKLHLFYTLFSILVPPHCPKHCCKNTSLAFHLYHFPIHPLYLFHLATHRSLASLLPACLLLFLCSRIHPVCSASQPASQHTVRSRDQCPRQPFWAGSSKPPVNSKTSPLLRHEMYAPTAQRLCSALTSKCSFAGVKSSCTPDSGKNGWGPSAAKGSAVLQSWNPPATINLEWLSKAWPNYLVYLVQREK